VDAYQQKNLGSIRPW